jgi:hypothetical protein
MERMRDVERRAEVGAAFGDADSWLRRRWVTGRNTDIVRTSETLPLMLD